MRHNARCPKQTRVHFREQALVNKTDREFESHCGQLEEDLVEPKKLENLSFVVALHTVSCLLSEAPVKSGCAPGDLACDDHTPIERRLMTRDQLGHFLEDLLLQRRDSQAALKESWAIDEIYCTIIRPNSTIYGVTAPSIDSLEKGSGSEQLTSEMTSTQSEADVFLM